MYLGAQGVQVELAGRLGGVEKSRKIRLAKGSIPRQTFRADIDYAYTTAKTTYGIMASKFGSSHNRYMVREISR